MTFHGEVTGRRERGERDTARRSVTARRSQRPRGADAQPRSRMRPRSSSRRPPPPRRASSSLAAAAVDLRRRRRAAAEVSGSVRTARTRNLRRAGFDAHVFDLDDGYTGLDDRGLAALASATHVLATVPPVADFDRGPLLALHGDALAAGRVAALGGLPLDDERVRRPRRRLVDERAETRAGGRPPPRGCRPSASGSSARAAAAGWRRTSSASPASTGRGARRCTRSLARRHERRRRARGAAPTTTRRRRCSATSAPSAPTGLRPSTSARPRRRHWRRAPRVDGAPAASADAAVYNIGDDEPAPRQEVMAHAAHLLGLPLTEGGGRRAGQTPTARRAASTSASTTADARRAAAARPAFPGYREGRRR